MAFEIDLWVFLACSGKVFNVVFCLKLHGLPGGEQVDGLPPAASGLMRQTSLAWIGVGS